MKVKIELEPGNYIETSAKKVMPKSKDRFYIIYNVEWAEVITE